jgi:hypothetical protein
MLNTALLYRYWSLKKYHGFTPCFLVRSVLVFFVFCVVFKFLVCLSSVSCAQFCRCLKFVHYWLPRRSWSTLIQLSKQTHWRQHFYINGMNKVHDLCVYFRFQVNFMKKNIMLPANFNWIKVLQLRQYGMFCCSFLLKSEEN